MCKNKQISGKDNRIRRSQAVSNGLTSIDGKFEYQYDIHNVSKSIREKKFNTLAEVHHFMKQNKLWQDFGKGQEDDYWYLRDKAAEFEWDAKQKKSLVTTKQPLQLFAVKHIAAQKEGLKGTDKLRLRYKKPTFNTTQDEQIFESELLEKIENKIPLSYGEFLYATEEMYLPEHLQRDIEVKTEDMHKAIWTHSRGSFDKFVKNTIPLQTYAAKYLL